VFVRQWLEYNLLTVLFVNQWEVKAPMPSSCFRAIVRQISKLHEAIYGLLPSSQVQVCKSHNYIIISSHVSIYIACNIAFMLTFAVFQIVTNKSKCIRCCQYDKKFMLCTNILQR